MEKQKLKKMRETKGFSKSDIAKKLGILPSSYHRRESGKTKIQTDEWLKHSEILNVKLPEIYESDDNQTFINNENAIGNIFGATTFINIPKDLVEILVNYIIDLKAENKELNKQKRQQK